MMTAFKLRKEHVGAFEQSSFEEFTERVLRHLRKHFPNAEEVSSREAFKNWFAQVMAKAKPWNVISEQGIVGLAYLCLKLGVAFDQDLRWVRVTRVVSDAARPDIRRVFQALSLAHLLQEAESGGGR